MTARATTATPQPPAKVGDALHQQNCLPAHSPAARLGGTCLCAAVKTVLQTSGCAKPYGL